MKKMTFIAAVLLMMPGVASAFPIAVGAAGVGVLGVMALPFALLVAASVWAYKTKGRGLLPLVALLLAAVSFLFLVRDYAQDQEGKAALFTNADASFLSPSIPFPFVEPADQAQSPQAVTPAEFMAGIEKGHFKALKISTYPSLFMQTGQVGVDDFWRNKDLLVNAVNQLGGRVVLVDEYGGIAASVAGAALRNFGLSVGFLQGGTAALSKFGWQQIDSGEKVDGSLVTVPEYKNWISQHPGAYVLGITTDREFVQDGWVFGDRTLTLADLVANYDEIVRQTIGRSIFVVGFETNDTGATPIAVSLLAKAGLDVHYVMPDHDEILIKPAYYDAYPNDTRTVSVEDAERYVLHRDDVEFLDFSERPWPIGVGFLKGRYHHLPMSEVAKGKLASFVAGLDPSKVYIGLAFDRRTAYHALLAGELLSKRGAPWLGRFTEASSLTEPFLTVDDLNTDDEQTAYAVRELGGAIGYWMLGHGFALAILYGIITALPGIAIRRRRTVRNTLIIALEVIASCFAYQANADYPQTALAYSAFSVANTLGMLLVAYVAWRLNQPPIKAFSQFTQALPPKAALLNVAAERGYAVAKGIVVAVEDLHQLPTAQHKQGRYIVRSAAMQESASHGATAGLFDSFVCANAADIPGRAIALFDSFSAAGTDGYALVQEYVDGHWYGVIQLQGDEQSPYMVCDIGPAEAVTSGESSAKSFRFPAWDAKQAPREVRAVALALVDLMAAGAYSLEFALTSTGKLIVLQVNQSIFRACAGKRLQSSASKVVVEVGSAHPDPLSAAIVAALSPGHIFAFGTRRFCTVHAKWQTKLTVRNDLLALGFLPHKVKARHLVAWVDRHSRNTDLTAPSKADVHAVVDAVRNAAESIGRMNRIATSMLSVGRTSSWAGEFRYLASSHVGQMLDQSGKAAWLGMTVSPLSGFAASSNVEDFSDDELSAFLIEAATPEQWVKDATSVMLAIRLAALKPAVMQLIAEGEGQQLIDALESQVGYWGASLQVRESIPAVQHPQKLSDVFSGHTVSARSWRIPADGVSGVVIAHEVGEASGILLIDRCNMSYLPSLSRATAVIARQGSITSHLMQHAAAMKLPVIIGAELPDGLQVGAQVNINPQGEVARA